MSDRSCRVGGSAGEHSAVLVIYVLNIQQTDLAAYHGGRHVGVGGDHLPLEAPGDGDWEVSSLNVTHDGGCLALVYRSRAKRKRNNFWRF